MTTHWAIIALTLLVAVLGLRVVWSSRTLPAVPLAMLLKSFACLILFLLFALVGAFWESHVLGQFLRQAASRGETTPVGYWRTAGGPEVDMVIERAGSPDPLSRLVSTVVMTWWLSGERGGWPVARPARR